jgi:hypothetical protein
MQSRHEHWNYIETRALSTALWSNSSGCPELAERWIPRQLSPRIARGLRATLGHSLGVVYHAFLPRPRAHAQSQFAGPVCATGAVFTPEESFS